MRIACLHTAESNIAVFEAAAAELGLAAGALHHTVRPDLLARAEADGGLTADLREETVALLLSLAQGHAAVVLTCSTLGPSVDGLAERAGVPVLRVDAVLARQAVASGGRVVALCAVETTLGPTGRLFAAAAAKTGAPVEVRLVAGAWDLFKAGDRDGYLAKIAGAAEAAYAEGAATVALAQASMAGAAVRITQGPKPLTSPAAGLADVAGLVSR